MQASGTPEHTGECQQRRSRTLILLPEQEVLLQGQQAVQLLAVPVHCRRCHRSLLLAHQRGHLAEGN